VLILEDVHVRYGAVAALRGVSLRVDQGEMVGLIGVNGAGKTTTLLTIAGVLRPTRGSITFAGTSLVGQPPEDIVRRGIALVPEGRRIFPGLSVAWAQLPGANAPPSRVTLRRCVLASRFSASD
jgi:branched-chain amino acid transport system ATP-binding protein